MKRARERLRIRLLPWATSIQVVLASLFLIAVVGVTIYNVQGIVNNPKLGTWLTYTRSVELIRDTFLQSPTKETLIGLATGDGMRFVNFIADTLPEDTSIVFPTDESGALQPSEYFRHTGFAHFIPYLYPRKLQTETYDFQSLPYDSRNLSTMPQEYRLVSREYFHSSQDWVFQIFVSPDAKRYRLFFNIRPVPSQFGYNHVRTFVAYPEGLNP
ncbi:MAG: hypothetical protein V1724_01540 [Chloroflexota bacterium]